eukprot:3752346-Pyramimonas_sp.AAC.1
METAGQTDSSWQTNLPEHHNLSGQCSLRRQQRSARWYCACPSCSSWNIVMTGSEPPKRNRECHEYWGDSVHRANGRPPSTSIPCKNC